MSDSIEVQINDATKKQLLKAILRENRRFQRKVEKFMTDQTAATERLEGSVSRVEGAVSAVRDRVNDILGTVDPLKEALAAAQETIRAEREADATEDADYEARIAARDEALANLETVIEEQSAKIDTATAALDEIAKPAENPEG